MGMHLTSPVVHSPGRAVSLGLSARRRAVRPLRHRVGPHVRSTRPASTPIAGWVALAQAARDRSSHTGRARARRRHRMPAIDVRGVVAADAASAVFTITQIATSVAYPPGRFRCRASTPTAGTACGSSAGSVADGPGQSPLAWAEQPITLTGRRTRRGRASAARAVPPAGHAGRSSSTSTDHLDTDHRPPTAPERARRRTMTDDITRPSPHRKRRASGAARSSRHRRHRRLLLAGCASPGDSDVVDPELLPVQGRGARGLQRDHRRLRGREPRHQGRAEPGRRRRHDHPHAAGEGQGARRHHPERERRLRQARAGRGVLRLLGRAGARDDQPRRAGDPRATSATRRARSTGSAT